jgi:hypothetical protein
LQLFALLAPLLCRTCDFFFCALICSRKDEWELYDALNCTQLQGIAKTP